MKKAIIICPSQVTLATDTFRGGMGTRGGAARALLLRALGMNATSMPRDVDIIRLTCTETGGWTDEEVAQEFMWEDASNGHGVELIESLADYFATRDFSINEIFATDEEVIATEQCLLDTVRHILRLTPFEKEDWRNRPKMFSKMVRLYAEGIVRNEPVVMEENAWRYEKAFLTPFRMAVQLDRAFERGSAVAETFVSKLKQYQQLPEECVGAKEAVEYLSRCMAGYEYPFYYRHAPFDQFEAEDRWIEEAKIQDDFERKVKQSKKKKNR